MNTPMRCIPHISIALAIQTTFAAAQTVTVESYLHPRDRSEEQVNQIFLAGSKDALVVFNVGVGQEYGLNQQFFCLPDKLALTTAQADNIVRQWLKEQASTITEMPISMALLFGLQETFPCKK
jgi:hypothetical protein